MIYASRPKMAVGLIKHVTRSCRYYLTRLGRAAIAAACSLRSFRSSPPLPLSSDQFFANSVN